MDRRGASDDPSPYCVARLSRGGLAIEFLERSLLARTRVWASEKAVPQRAGGSAVTTAAGRCIMGSACLLSDGHTTVLSVMSTGSDGPIDGPVAAVAEVFLPSRTDMLRSSGVRLPALDGESRDAESIDGRPGVLF